MLSTLGRDYVGTLRTRFAGRLPGGVDLVTYWFEKSLACIAAGRLQSAGLVSTQAIRRGSNRVVLDNIITEGKIFDAWADEAWVVDGADVRVSLVAFGTNELDRKIILDGNAATKIYSDLSAGATDLTKAVGLPENLHLCFQGPVKVGPFEIDGETARGWLRLPCNPNGRPNNDVIRPWLNGQDMTRRASDTWIVDFAEMSEKEAALYEAPFKYVRDTVKPLRDTNNRERRKRFWWQHGETVPGLRRKVKGLRRLIGTPRVSKHRFFAWIDPTVLPDSRVNIIVRDDDVAFGILHSRFHQAWSLRLGGWHGVGNDPQYTPTTGFEAFPFPKGLTPNVPSAIYAADPHALTISTSAKHLNELRELWLNPPDLVRRQAEVAPGFPDRILPVDDNAAVILKSRTMTSLYNERPTWLAHAHADLDAAVAAAYGWPADISEDDALAKLFELNQTRSASNGFV